MATKDIITNLIAKDQMSGPLRKISVEADKLDDALEETGESAQEAGEKTQRGAEKGAQGMKALGDAAQDTESRTRALNAGLSLLGAGLAYAGTKAMDQERQLIALRSAFGDYADEVIQFAEELDNVTMFSDDDIREGQRFFATLQNNYDLTIDQIKNLMEVTADLASASGVTFADASNRVTAAIRGEAEAAEYLGLTMNQASIDRENLTLTMSNQEAAQFRYNALLEQSSYYQGTANEMMQTSAGTIAEWRDRMEDAGASVGEFIGPIGTLTTGMGTLGIGVTGLTTGVNLLGTALGRVTPMGIAITAVVGGVAALTTTFMKHRAEAKEAEQVIVELKDAYLDLTVAANQARLEGNTQQAAYLDQLRTQTADVIAEAEGIIDDAADLKFNGETISIDRFREMKEEYRLTSEEADRFTASQERLQLALMDSSVDGAALASDIDELYWRFKRGEITLDEYNVMLEEISLNTDRYAKSADDATVSIQGMTDAQREFNFELNNMRLDGDWALADQLEEINGSIRRGQGEISGYADSVEYLNGKVKDGTLDGEAFNDFLTQQNIALANGDISWQEYQESINRYALNLPYIVLQQEQLARSTAAQESALTAAQMAMRGYTDDQIALNLAIGTFIAIEEDLVSSIESGIASGVGLTNTMRMIRNESAGLGESINAGVTPAVDDLRLLEETLTGILDLVGSGDLRSQLNLAGAGSDAGLAADGLMDASTALDTTYRVIVGNTNAIASQVDGIHSWAEELINVEGTYGEIDRLLASGLITQQQYNDAQQAYNTIAAANVQIQDDVLAIQAQQAPLIASQADAMADYVEQIRLMNDGTVEGATRQLEALAWMDDGLQQQAMNVSMFADQLDDLGPKGEEAFGQMVASIEATNPALFTMLETMGYVSNVVRDEDGKVISYDVNIDGADGAMSDIERLTLSIDALIETLGGIPPSVDMDVNANDNATEPIRTARTEAENLDGTTSTINVVANDQASAVLGSLASTWGGTIATSFVDVITRRYKQGTPGQALGGVVGYARGGVVTELAEAGPEILHFASGGTAYVGTRGIYAVEPGTYVQPNNAISNSYGGDTVFNITVNGGDEASIRRVMIDEVLPEFRRATAALNTGLGVM